MKISGRVGIRIVVLATCFVSMFWLSFGLQNVYASPDERANIFFAETFSQTGSFCAHEALNTKVQGIIHPRSTIAIDECIVPSSFLGMPILLAGLLFVFSLFGQTLATMSAFVVTPMLAIGGVVAWWWIVRRQTRSENIADLAAMMTLFHPALWYYGARVMMHNVPFVALLLIATALGIAAWERKFRLLSVFAGVVFGVALSMRLVEAPLIFLLLTAGLIVFRRSVSWKHVVMSGFGMASVLCIYAVGNAAIYGSPFITGYTVPPVSVGDVVSDGLQGGSSILRSAMDLMFPFGIHPRAMLRNVWLYGVVLYPITSFLAAVGIIAALWRKSFNWRVAALFLVFAALWMASVYGSWVVTDNIDPTAVTVGNSYVRYWLPLFVASSVFVAIVLDWCWSQGIKWKVGVVILLIAMVGWNSRVVFGGSDGFIATRAALHTFEEKRDVVVELAGCADGGDQRPIIVVDHADKFLFPVCRVIVPLRSEVTYAALSTLVVEAPVYYYGLTLPEKDIEFLNTTKLLDQDLQIQKVQTVFDETLYRIVPIEYE